MCACMCVFFSTVFFFLNKFVLYKLQIYIHWYITHARMLMCTCTHTQRHNEPTSVWNPAWNENYFPCKKKSVESKRVDWLKESNNIFLTPLCFNNRILVIILASKNLPWFYQRNFITIIRKANYNFQWHGIPAINQLLTSHQTFNLLIQG